MVNVEIPEELNASLEQAATRAGRTKDDLVHHVLKTHIEEEYAANATFSDEQIAKLRLGIDQIDRGEVYTSAQIDDFFDGWFKELDAR